MHNRCKSAAMLTAFSIISCTDTSVDAPVNEPTDVIMPLKPGNEWLYNLISINNNGIAEIYESYFGSRAVLDTVINGSRWTRMSDDGDLLQNRADGLYGKDIKDLAKKGITGIQRLIPYPAAVKQYYQVGGNVLFLDSTNAVVKTPAGEFTCYKFTSELTTESSGDVQHHEIHNYWAPNYGNIQTVTRTVQPDSLKSKPYIQQLRSIKLK